MDYLTVFITNTALTGIIVRINTKNTALITKHVIPITVPDEIESGLVCLLNQCKREVAKQKKLVCRLLLVDEKWLQHELSLPNVALSHYEIDQYIQTILAKVFQTKQPLSYDYLAKGSLSHNRQIVLYAYPSALITRYCELFHPLKLSFIGIASEMLTQESKGQLSASKVDSLATVAVLAGVNFLPWRKRRQKHKQQYLLITLIAYLALGCLSICLWLSHINQQLKQQLLQNQHYQTKLTQKTVQLADLAHLSDTMQQHSDSVRQMAIKQQLMILVKYLTFIALAVPDGVWLSSLSYQPDQFEISGDSLGYADILLFSQHLSQTTLTEQHSIRAITQQHNFLQFTIDMLLTAQETANAE